MYPTAHGESGEHGLRAHLLTAFSALTLVMAVAACASAQTGGPYELTLNTIDADALALGDHDAHDGANDDGKHNRDRDRHSVNQPHGVGNVAANDDPDTAAHGHGVTNVHVLGNRHRDSTHPGGIADTHGDSDRHADPLAAPDHHRHTNPTNRSVRR